MSILGGVSAMYIRPRSYYFIMLGVYLQSHEIFLSCYSCGVRSHPMPSLNLDKATEPPNSLVLLYEL